VSAPKLPDGAVMLGLGRHFNTDGKWFDGWRFCAPDGDTKWEWDDEWEGCDPFAFYAAPLDSEIARLNGHGLETASEPTKDSEAVALVRKLAEQLSKRLDGDEWVWQDAMGVRKEAEAFLAREDGK